MRPPPISTLSQALLTALRIVELLKQLFYKQNRYAANNSTYGPKAAESREGSRDITSSVQQLASLGKMSNAQPGMVTLKLGNQQKAK